MKSIAIVVIAAVMTTAAAPAFARAEGSFGRAKVTFNEKTNTYCFKEEQAGSLVPRVDCRTKAEWSDAGLTITHKPAVQLAQR